MSQYLCPISVYSSQQHPKSLKTKLAKEMHWGGTTAGKSGISHVVSFDALDNDFTFMAHYLSLMAGKTLLL